MIDEPIERVEHLQLVHVSTGANGLGRAQIERAAEHRGAEEHGAFAVAEQVHTPRDRSLEGLLSWQRQARAAGEEAERIVEAVEDPRGRQRLGSRCGEFDRERDAVETLADLGDGRSVVVVEHETRSRPSSAIEEEADGVELTQPLDRNHHARRGQSERRDPPGDLARKVEQASAGGQHHDVGASLQHGGDQLGDRFHQMFAVVEHQQRRLVAEALCDRVRRRLVTLQLHTQQRRHLDRHVAGVGEWCELDPPHSVGESIHLFGSRLQGEAGLAGTAGSGDRHHPLRGEQVRDGGQLVDATDEGREANRKVVRGRIERPQRCEVAEQLRMHQLVDALRASEVLQAVVAEIPQRDLIAELVERQIPRRRRHQDLAATGQAAQSRRANDGHPDVVRFVAQPGLTGVDRHPHGDRGGCRPGLALQGSLRIQRPTQGVGGSTECGDDAVAFALLLRANPTVCRDRRVEDLVVTGHGRSHRIGRELPFLRRALDVGEEERDRPGRKAHRSSQTHRR